jgi:hypothetical protein
MISSSQISLFQNDSRQVSAVDSSHIRVNQSRTTPVQDGNARGTEVALLRQAAYRYNSQEQIVYSSTGAVFDGSQRSVFTTAELTERTTDLLLMGQQAIHVSRAALGGDSQLQGQGGLSVTAGRYMFYSESESRSFASTGTITMDDGKAIDFTLSLRQSQSRTYEYSESIQIRERPMTDPLVINFGSATAQLTDTLLEFDMNGDGKSGMFATLGSGSGYLVFDRNGNGKVDDGSELFGPQSGSGFSELAKYDDDGNLWIDANDEIYNSLSVWVQTADGSQELRSLEEVGVKALYADSINDSFTLANGQGIPLGQITASGIYLTTDGEVRTLEEVNLAEQKAVQGPVVQEILATRPGMSASSNGNAGSTGGMADARIDAIRSALTKLNEIREKQQAFIEESKNAGKPKSALDNYLSIIDRLRLELLNSQDEKKQAASRYLEFATL